MRSLKSVLLSSGNYRRNHPNFPESEIIITVIEISNIPKLIPQDVPLFQGIQNDLFTDVQFERPKYKMLFD